MKKSTLFLFIVLGCSIAGFGQDTEKIKGDRILTIKQTYVNSFKKIVVGEDFKVELFYNKKPSVEIETDDNLHEHIDIQVVDSVLTFTRLRGIRAKKLTIKVNYDDSFSEIEVKDEGEVRSLTSLELNNASLKTSGSSRAYLNIKTNNFNFISNDKTKVKLNITATNMTAEISDNSKLEATINATDVKMDLYQRTNADVDGTVENLTIRADNNALFSGKNFTSKICNVIAEIASDVYVEVTEAIIIEVSGSSEIYLFGDPKITINRFSDTVKLQKKEK